MDAQSKLIGVVSAGEWKPGSEIISNPINVNPNTKIGDILLTAAETPYPLPVVSSNGVLLGVVSKSTLLRAVK